VAILWRIAFVNLILLSIGTDGDGDGQRWEKQTRPDAFALVYGGIEASTGGSRGRVPFNNRIIIYFLNE